MEAAFVRSWASTEHFLTWASRLMCCQTVIGKLPGRIGFNAALAARPLISQAGLIRSEPWRSGPRSINRPLPRTGIGPKRSDCDRRMHLPIPNQRGGGEAALSASGEFVDATRAAVAQRPETVQARSLSPGLGGEIRR